MAVELGFSPGAVIVAGGSGGIGAAICKGLAAAGLPVVFTCHSNPDKAHAFKRDIDAAGGQCDFMQVDLSVPDEVEPVPVKDIMSAAPKAAIEMRIRGVAKESGRLGIGANCVGPGWINAGRGKKGIEEKLDDKQRQVILRQMIPLQRFGEAEDVAQAALFLCSRQANYITGQSLAVDGGMQL